MFTESYYALRARTSGQYLTARMSSTAQGYMLVFPEHADALSYLNTHSPDYRDQFVVELLSAQQLRATLERWQLQGLGVVRDPLIPQIEFLKLE